MEISKKINSIKMYSADSVHKDNAFKGTHILLELYQCNSQKLNDELYLRCLIGNSARIAKAKVLNLISNKFEPHGVTAIALLAESHLSIHTWPESEYSAVDIFTCGNNARPELASQFLINQLEAKKHLIKTINRNYPANIENQIRQPS